MFVWMVKLCDLIVVAGTASFTTDGKATIKFKVNSHSACWRKQTDVLNSSQRSLKLVVHILSQSQPILTICYNPVMNLWVFSALPTHLFFNFELKGTFLKYHLKWLPVEWHRPFPSIRAGSCIVPQYLMGNYKHFHLLTD